MIEIVYSSQDWIVVYDYMRPQAIKEGAGGQNKPAPVTYHPHGTKFSIDTTRPRGQMVQPLKK